MNNIDPHKNLGNCRKIYIEEKNGRKSGRLGLDLGTPTWDRDLLGGCFGFEHPMGFCESSISSLKITSTTISPSNQLKKYLRSI